MQAYKWMPGISFAQTNATFKFIKFSLLGPYRRDMASILLSCKVLAHGIFRSYIALGHFNNLSSCY